MKKTTAPADAPQAPPEGADEPATTAERRQLERRRLEQERDALLISERAARLEAERTSRVKDEFVATLSHELRTPLHAILGWTHVLLNPASRDAHLEAGLRAIERNARAQARMIDELLDMSRIISGKVRLDIQHVALAPLVAAAAESIRPAADAKGITLDMRVSAGTAVNADPSRLQQVVWNLLSNAVKFTPQGGRVSVAANDEPGESAVKIVVSDTGEGIAAHFLPYVFERFRQGDASTTRRYSGLGLGLSIAKQIVELHGGTVAAESPGPGQGATFHVSLPVRGPDAGTATPLPRPPQAEEPSEPTAMPEPSMAGLKVLIVDDVEDTRDLMQVLLQNQQAEVLAVASGAQALVLLRLERPDLLLCDIGMPHMDGYELIRALRSLPAEFGGATPALAVTAFARPEDCQRALDAGYNGYLAKPVALGELLAAIERLRLRDPDKLA
jgi:signal transduction histidine kinase/CheY-like chemotaxis protein